MLQTVMHSRFGQNYLFKINDASDEIVSKAMPLSRMSYEKTNVHLLINRFQSDKTQVLFLDMTTFNRILYFNKAHDTVIDYMVSLHHLNILMQLSTGRAESHNGSLSMTLLNIVCFNRNSKCVKKLITLKPTTHCQSTTEVN